MANSARPQGAPFRLADVRKFELLASLSSLAWPELLLDFFMTRPALRRRSFALVRVHSFGLRPLGLMCSVRRIRLGLPGSSVLLYGRLNRLVLRVPVLSPALNRMSNPTSQVR